MTLVSIILCRSPVVSYENEDPASGLHTFGTVDEKLEILNRIADLLLLLNPKGTKAQPAGITAVPLDVD